MASTTIEQALDAKLRAYGSGSWLATVTGGMYPYSAPDGVAEPYCFYNVIADPTEEESFESTDTGSARVQFDFVTKTKAGKSIALAARKILNHAVPWSDGVTVIAVTCEGVRDIELAGNAWQWQFDARVDYVRA